MKILKEILEHTLKVNDPEKSGSMDKWSFSRIALLISFVAYVACAVTYLFMSIYHPTTTTPEMVQTILSSLEYPILIFAGYSFGGKTLKSLEGILGNRKDVSSSSSDERNATKDNTSTPTNTTDPLI